ncbi:hypothetical protein VC857_25260, partial [Citrobacter braakii]
VRALLVTEPYRRIRKTSGYAGGYLFRFVQFMSCHLSPALVAQGQLSAAARRKADELNHLHI